MSNLKAESCRLSFAPAVTSEPTDILLSSRVSREEFSFSGFQSRNKKQAQDIQSLSVQSAGPGRLINHALELTRLKGKEVKSSVMKSCETSEHSTEKGQQVTVV